MIIFYHRIHIKYFVEYLCLKDPKGVEATNYYGRTPLQPITSRLMHQAEHQLIQQETSMGEDTLETLAMCAVVMGIVMLPQLIN